MIFWNCSLTCDLWACTEIISYRKSRYHPSLCRRHLLKWLLGHHAHTLHIMETLHQSCGSIVVSLSSCIWSSEWMCWHCEHEEWIDLIQLELDNSIAIYICSCNETVSNKAKNESGFVIRSARTYYPPVLWKPTCDQIEFPFQGRFFLTGISSL